MILVKMQKHLTPIHTLTAFRVMYVHVERWVVGPTLEGANEGGGPPTGTLDNDNILNKLNPPTGTLDNDNNLNQPPITGTPGIVNNLNKPTPPTGTIDNDNILNNKTRDINTITLMGHSTGCNIICRYLKYFNKYKFMINKFYS